MSVPLQFAGKAQRQQNVSPHGGPRQKRRPLKHQHRTANRALGADPIDAHLPSRGPQQSGDKMKQGRLAGAGTSNDGNVFAGGVMLARPFKITGIGPVRLFVRDMAKSLDFYTQQLGFVVSEEVVLRGHRCIFLRINTEHHSLALYPEALRDVRRPQLP